MAEEKITFAEADLTAVQLKTVVTESKPAACADPAIIANLGASPRVASMNSTMCTL
jgi:hypothetical protein